MQPINIWMTTVLNRLQWDAACCAWTINNGASTATIPRSMDMFDKLEHPALDVHTSAEHAEQPHRWFFDKLANSTDQGN